ncbi:MAG: hypothetical protein LBL54_01765 [Clostridiales Family XIII bacterium]|jgi:hypothetical protein|nr:hypothetical protein [Clostridiales Family XIII bacterium]
MKTFVLIPTIKCGEIEFLSNRARVRSLLGTYKTFLKSNTSENTTDDFGYCHAYYDSSNRIIAIEFFPEANLQYNEITLFLLTAKELTKLLESNDRDIQADNYSVLSRKLGICAEIDDDEIKSILVCTADYYD